VDKALRTWVLEVVKQHPELVRLGYFGSYARGDWGVGSDLDLVAIVTESPEPFERRSLQWNVDSLPVPAELLIYTQMEWQQLQEKAGRFAQTMARETVWLYAE
jgi:predicted nucleotidyltransferase